MKTIDKLLVKYMHGEAKLADMEAIDRWITTSAPNFKYFTHFKLLWDISFLLKIESHIDVDQAWNEFKEIAERNSRPEAIIRQLYPPKSRIGVAALWLLALGIGGLLYNLLYPDKAVMRELHTLNEVRVDTLAAGPVITLNKNTVLYLFEKFAGKTAEVKFKKGEAFFDMSADNGKPFLIRVNDVAVRATSASFNMKNRDSSTEIIVESGIIEVNRRAETIELHAGEKININYKSQELTKEQNTDKLYTYYRTQLFIANNTPLWRIVQVLNEAYGVNIIIADKQLPNQTLTTILRNGQLDTNLNVICSTLNARMRKQHGNIIIY